MGIVNSPIGSTWASRGQKKNAEEWVFRMERYGLALDAHSYCSVINACAIAGDVERAEYWIERMVQSGLKPNEEMYNVLLKVCACKGDTDRMEHLLKMMRVAMVADQLWPL